jgi:hypothetical protein
VAATGMIGNGRVLVDGHHVVQTGSGYPYRAELADLVLHQRHQGRDDDGQALE